MAADLTETDEGTDRSASLANRTTLILVTMTDQLKIEATKSAAKTSFPSKVASVKAYTSPPD